MPTLLSERLRRAIARARRQERALLEPDAYDLVRMLGISVPAFRRVRDSNALRQADLQQLPGERVVLKAVATDLLHKSEAGGVRILPKIMTAVREAMQQMERAIGASHDIEGFLLCEWIDHDRALGSELLLGMRWSDDFGALVSLAPGGTDANLLADQLEGTGATTVCSPAMGDRSETHLNRKPFVSALWTPRHGQPARFTRDALTRVVANAVAFAERAIPRHLTELEINPLVSTASGLVALDALARPGGGGPVIPDTRPIDQIRYLLQPRSVAVVGVSSTRLNPGRLIVRRLLAAGYDGRLTIVKPDVDTLDGCPCVQRLEDLEAPVDLLILSLAASQAAAWVERVVDANTAHSILLTSGGFEEKSDGDGPAEHLRAKLRQRRDAGQPTPLVNGANCLGVRSVPGRLDTLFIPEEKLPVGLGPAEPLAIISQSGAFAIAQDSRLHRLSPRYLISVGNQTDVTVGDYLSYLSRERDLEIFACYVEGFRPLDGRRFLEAALDIHESGRAVVLYKGGRTRRGAAAATSHTAAVAGSYRTMKELAETAGILVADTVDDFTDLVRLLSRFQGRHVGGRRIGVLSNAGFECVATADAVSAAGLELSPLTSDTRDRLRSLLHAQRVDELVGVRNPLDVTPMLDDESFAAAARLLLADNTVDVAVVGCVPLAGTLHTVPPFCPDAVADRLARLFADTTKPWVAVVDGGSLYDPMVDVLETEGVPVFRSADRAVRLLGRLATWRCAPASP